MVHATQSEPSETGAPSEPVELDALTSAYDNQAEWIRFADAKAGAVLTANGALIGLLVPTLDELLKALRQSEVGVAPLALALFVGWLLVAASSAVRAFRCITPFSYRGRHPADEACPHFHSVGIAKCYRIDELSKFAEDSARLGSGGYRQQILAATLIDAHVSTSKYAHVTASIRLLGASAVLALLYVLALQFVQLYSALAGG